MKQVDGLVPVWCVSTEMPFQTDYDTSFVCASAKHTTALCFSIRGGDARVPGPSHTWGAEGF